MPDWLSWGQALIQTGGFGVAGFLLWERYGMSKRRDSLDERRIAADIQTATAIEKLSFIIEERVPKRGE